MTLTDHTTITVSRESLSMTVPPAPRMLLDCSVRLTTRFYDPSWAYWYIYLNEATVSWQDGRKA